MPHLPDSTIPSPCVRLCTLNDEDVCVGCGRTLADITGWTRMSEPEKAQCVQKARERLDGMEAMRSAWAAGRNRPAK